MDGELVGTELLGRREEHGAEPTRLTYEAIVIVRGGWGFAILLKLTHFQNNFEAARPRLREFTNCI